MALNIYTDVIKANVKAKNSIWYTDTHSALKIIENRNWSQ